MTTSTAARRGRSPAAPSRRSQRELLLAQIDGIACWQALRAEAPAPQGVLSREDRLDLARSREALETERAALLAAVDAQPTWSTSGDADTRAVVAHHDAWARRHLTLLLEQHAVVVVAELENGAAAVGTAAAEQPDLLLLSDPIAMLCAETVVHRVRAVSPGTRVAVLARSGDHVVRLCEAGADAVFSRQLPPVDLVAQLLG